MFTLNSCSPYIEKIEIQPLNNFTIFFKDNENYSLMDIRLNQYKLIAGHDNIPSLKFDWVLDFKHSSVTFCGNLLQAAGLLKKDKIISADSFNILENALSKKHTPNKVKSQRFFQNHSETSIKKSSMFKMVLAKLCPQQNGKSSLK